MNLHFAPHLRASSQRITGQQLRRTCLLRTQRTSVWHYTPFPDAHRVTLDLASHFCSLWLVRGNISSRLAPGGWVLVQATFCGKQKQRTSMACTCGWRRMLRGGFFWLLRLRFAQLARALSCCCLGYCLHRHFAARLLHGVDAASCHTTTLKLVVPSRWYDDYGGLDEAWVLYLKAAAVAGFNTSTPLVRFLVHEVVNMCYLPLVWCVLWQSDLGGAQSSVTGCRQSLITSSRSWLLASSAAT